MRVDEGNDAVTEHAALPSSRNERVGLRGGGGDVTERRLEGRQGVRRARHAVGRDVAAPARDQRGREAVLERLGAGGEYEGLVRTSHW